MAARLLPLQLSLSLYCLHILTTLCTFCSLKTCLFYCLHLLCCQHWWPPTPAHSTMVAANSQWLVPSINLLHINGNKPNNHPLCYSCGATVRLLLQHRLASCSSSKLTIPRLSVAKFTGTRHTFQSSESPKHTFSHTKGSLQPDGLPLHI
jgi:hypothetical protein